MRRTAEQRGFSNRHLKQAFLTSYRTEQKRTEQNSRAGTAKSPAEVTAAHIVHKQKGQRTA